MKLGKLKITVLGTGTSQGVPVMTCSCPVCTSTNPKDQRLRVSVLIETAQSNLVIDCGPDFRQQMLREKVKRVDAVLLTHDHQDHVAGLDDLRSFIFAQNKPMPIYAEENVIHAVKQRFAYAFSKTPYPGAPVLDMLPIQPGQFHVEDLSVEAIRVQHGKLPILGFRIGQFAYVTDVNRIEEESAERLKDVDVLVIDALHHRTHHSHFNLQEAIAEVAKLKPEKAYFTHISHHMGLHEEVEKTLPENVHLAYDGLTFVF